MNERLQRYLDGELRREDLTPEELSEIALDEAVIREAKKLAMSINVPDMTAGVLARIDASEQSSSKSAGQKKIFPDVLRWLWAPRHIRLRPAYGLVATAVILFIVGLPPRETNPASSKVFVQFRLDAPGAKTVRLAGSFTGWKPSYALQEVTPGTWSTLIPLDSGVHNYAFVINDEQWLQDPAAPVVEDGFGGMNSRLSVLLPGEL